MIKVLKVILVSFLLHHCSFALLFGQEFINGDLESPGHTGCKKDIDNKTFNSLMPNLTALGTLDKLDILTSGCGNGVAQKGKNFVALEINNGFTDAFAIPLSENLVQGRFYFMSFYVRLDPNSIGKQFRLTLSMNIANNAYGEQLNSFNVSNTSWQKIAFKFKVPLEVKYITALLESFENVKVYVDNFEMTCPDKPNLGQDTTFCTFTNKELSVPDNFDSYEWSNGESKTNKIIAVEPGTYILKTKINSCIENDTINLLLDNDLCQCGIHIPNVFKTDPILIENGKWSAKIFCPIEDYTCRIYDRNGGLVFRSNDVNDTWDATFNNEPLQLGIYIYVVKFKKAKSNNFTQINGDILVLK
jgi:gliding motility-associated-like protein